MIKDFLGLETKIGYRFKKQELLTLALIHKSFASEVKDAKKNKNYTKHNEKLEFLGDAVLDLALSEILFAEFPEDDEGVLSKKRASLVNEEVLAKIARQLELERYLMLGKGELQTGGEKKPRLQASVFEAICGAMFLDAGYGEVKKMISVHFKEEIASLDEKIHFAKDYKTRLQEVIQKKYKVPPIYHLISETGPAHEKEFFSQVVVGDKVLGIGKGKTKKEAEQMAAEKALKETE